MCRRNQLLGVLIGAFGLGLLAAMFFESGVFCTCLGCLCLGVGIIVLQKK